MTLVEVIASLALLGSLLGASVVAQARLTRQWNAAQHRAAAVEALDAQLHAWGVLEHPSDSTTADPEVETAQLASFPTTGEGPLAKEPWWWLAQTLNDQPGSTWGITLIRYTAFDPSNPEQDAVATLDVFSFSPPPLAPEDEAASEAPASPRTGSYTWDRGER